jgi:phospho-N-acetylmuramoyl-pentapeptide-transferase
MLYYLFDFLETSSHLPGAGLFKYITFRAGLAILLSLMISMLFGNRIISYLKSLQINEAQRSLGLDGQQAKAKTPTMGGVIIVLGIVVPCLLLARLDNIYIQLLLFSTLWMAAIGFVDDYIKVFKKDKGGLKGRFKILGQVVLGLVIALVMLYHQDVIVRVDLAQAQLEKLEIIKEVVQKDAQGVQRTYAHVKTSLTNVPFVKGNILSYDDLLGFLGENASRWLAILFIPFVIFIVTAVSNAANLTDGLDGLAAGVSAIIGATLGVFAYVSGHALFSEYLDILYLPHSEEIVIFSACFIGTCIGFLWYNSYPAKVFMGDTGSLALGGVIAAMAILLRKELLIPMLCGIFLVENLSVIIQVFWFKYTRRRYGEGRRIFRMSPLHHHFQKLGMHESKIVTRFWIVGILLAVMTVITLKIR